jgi:hypothetical protein
VADWLRWRWQRHQNDHQNGQAWAWAVQEELPRRIARAEKAMEWISLGGVDKRTKHGRALKAALRAGGLARAMALAECVAASGGAVRPLGWQAPVKAAVPLLVRPWTPDVSRTGGKRAVPDRPKAQTAPPKPPGRIGRPRRVPEDAESLAALAAVLWSLDAGVREMYSTIESEADQMRFLLALRDLHADPDAPAVRDRWWALVSQQRMC